MLYKKFWSKEKSKFNNVEKKKFILKKIKLVKISVKTEIEFTFKLK